MDDLLWQATLSEAEVLELILLHQSFMDKPNLPTLNQSSMLPWKTEFNDNAAILDMSSFLNGDTYIPQTSGLYTHLEEKQATS